MKYLWRTCLVIIIFFCRSSASKIDEPQIKNPTTYEFHYSRNYVERAIIDALGSHKSSWSSISTPLLWGGTKRGKFYDYFLMENNSNRGFSLFPGTGGNPSKVYFKKSGEPYLYVPQSIDINLIVINENTTKVIIRIVDPKVQTKLSLSFPAIGGLRKWKYQPVMATTVEEYEILLRIGLELNNENMPELQIPKQIIF